MILSAEQKRFFQDRGYLVLPAITTPEEVNKLRHILGLLFATKAGFKEGAHLDMMGHEDDGQPARLPQILQPAHYAPELRNTLFRTTALAIARELYGEQAAPAFEHAILKPAGYGAPTPWHQDEVHRFDPNFDYQQLSIWMPLQEATVENGCIQYIPASHLGPCVPHHSPGDDPTIHALEALPGTFDPTQALPCPIPAGGCTIHHGRTLHHAGPNHSNGPRLAYVLAFETPPIPRTEPREFPWNTEKRTASGVRKKAWRRRGGFLVETWRKVRGGLLSNPRRLIFEFRRVTRAMLRPAKTTVLIPKGKPD